MNKKWSKKHRKKEARSNKKAIINKIIKN